MDAKTITSENGTMLISDKTVEDSKSKQVTPNQPSFSSQLASENAESSIAKEAMAKSSDEIPANTTPVTATSQTSTSLRIDDSAPQTLDQHGTRDEYIQIIDPPTQTTAAESSVLNNVTTSEDLKPLVTNSAPEASGTISAGPSLTSTGQEAVILQVPQYVSQPDIEVDLNVRFFLKQNSNSTVHCCKLLNIASVEYTTRMLIQLSGQCQRKAFPFSRTNLVSSF